MVAFITVLIIFLAILAVVQIVKVYEATSEVNEGRDFDITEKDNNLQGWFMMIFGIILMVSLAAMIVMWNDRMLPRSASLEGDEIDFLWGITMGLILVVFFIVEPILFYFTFRYRGKKAGKGVYYAHNNTLEFIWTTIPAISLAVLIIYGLTTWSNVMNPDNESEDPIVVEVYAQQFYWSVRYAGDDNILGDANIRNIAGVNALGVDPDDEQGWDDKVVREIVLPKGRPILFKFRSQDVIHSAFMPHFRAQMNCVPGMTTQFQFTPSLTTEEMRQDPQTMRKVAHINELRAEAGEAPYEFNYLLLCNKICGMAHYNMQMDIMVVEEAEYEQWISEQKTFAESL